MNKKCQVFTPNDYVEELLDRVGYVENLYGKKILENSCGDGNILISIVQRYIDDCKKKKMSVEKIKIGLVRDIHGVEIDPQQYFKCIFNLNEILKKNQIESLEWSIYNEDYLKKEDMNKYHFIVGNPPYVTYKELKKNDQIYLKNTFISCKKGKFDYCYAFIEKSINSLETVGKMAYLIPSSIFKTVFGANLREYMKPYIESIYDFTQEKMFDDALVKSAIMVLNANRKKDTLYYTDVTLNVAFDLPINNLAEKWFFTENMRQGEKRFGDYFKVNHVIATLLNEAYVIKDYIEMDNYFQCDNYLLEKHIVRDTATPRTLRNGIKEKIIFPYSYEEGRLKRYSEKEFENIFPNVFEYLSTYKEKLDKRKKDEGSKWFEYGRSQALNGLNKEKLLISTIITTEMPVYLLASDCIPYAGMYIVPKDTNNELSLEDAITILKSKDFIQYVSDVGIHISGSSLRITSKDIENYKF